MTYAYKKEITADRLRKLLSYDPLTGNFTWLAARNHLAPKGGRAGYTHPLGYRKICIERTTYMAHRLAWLYVHGTWPADEIDHIDGNGLNNAIANLRPATRAQNMRNSQVPRNNTSGAKGVHRRASGRGWRAYITVDRKRINLGTYESREQAIAAREAGKNRFHGEFARQ